MALTEQELRYEARQRKVWEGLPRRVKIGPGYWKVEFEEGLKSKQEEELFGETRNLTMELVFEPTQSFYQARDTVVHEILHAISTNVTYFAHCNPKTRAKTMDEEGMCRTFSPWLLQVIQDNPQLIEWLQQGEEEAHE